MQVVTLAEQFPEEYKEACLSINLENILPELLDDAQAVDVCKKISSILDTQAAE